MMPREGATMSKAGLQRQQNGNSGMNTFGENSKVISNENDSLLTHQGGKKVNQTLYIETRHQRSKLHIDQRSIHITRTNELVLSNIELLSRLWKSCFTTLIHKIKNLLRLQTSHCLGNLYQMREDGKVRSSTQLSLLFVPASYIANHLRESLTHIISASNTFGKITTTESIQTLSIVSSKDNSVFLSIESCKMNPKAYGSYTLRGLISL